MRYAIITAILALGLAGCNLNGLTFDTSALPNLNIDEVNCNNCNVNVNTADGGQQNVESHYFAIWEGYKDQEQEEVSILGGLSSDPVWNYGSKEATDEAYGNDPRRVDVDGDLGLFIEYNFDSRVEEMYFAIGGNSERNLTQMPSGYKFDDYTPMPIGNYQYSGKIVTRSYSDNTFRNGTVNAEVNFTDNEMWIEFENTTEFDRRFEDIAIDVEKGIFGYDIVGEGIEAENTAVFGVGGKFIGMEAKGMAGGVFKRTFYDTIDLVAAGIFVAERSDAPVIAED